jgi:DNA topoisomerase-1
MFIERKGDYNKGFTYIYRKTNQNVVDSTLLEWIKSLKIPPAYNSVKINTNAKSKILAIGYDSKGRKQYIYNPKFIEKRSKEKYKKILKLQEVFHKIQEQIIKDLKSSNIQIKQIAIILYLIINCGFRIGNKCYEKENGSYGISTIKFEHIDLKNKNIFFDFIGKKGVRNQATCVNNIIYQYLLKKKKEDNNKNSYVFDNIDSSDINKYLKQFDKNITSKDLRTWNANALFMQFAKQAVDSGIKNPIKWSMTEVSNKLHNTVNVCKKSYIDPKIVDFVSSKLKK